MNNIVLFTPETLDNDYTALLNDSVKFADKISEGINMADLGAAQEELLEVAREISGISNTTKKMGFVGRLLQSAKSKAEDEVNKRKSVNEVVDNMFEMLNSRQRKLVKAVQVLETVEDSLKSEELALKRLETGSNKLLGDGTLKGSEIMVCTSVSTQCGVSILKNNKNQQTVDVVMKTAMQLSSDVSKQLPKLRQALNSELTMSQTLNELREFKEAFDTTTDAIDTLSDANNDQMFEMMNAVLDVQSRDQKEVARIDKQSKLNAERTEILRKKVKQGEKHKTELLNKVTEMRKTQHFSLLGEDK